jgi:NAD(P)-dependent dehydrogenase (short-subunit alcohol dehydrogenase family)
VTGGASGIGLALCTRFAKEGADVVLSDPTRKPVTVTPRRSERFRSQPMSVGKKDIKNLVVATIEHFRRRSEVARPS